MNKPNEKKIEKLAIIGTGQMGSGVAQVSLPVCDTVLMKDISLDAVSKGMDTVYNSLQKLVQKNKLTQFQAEALYGKMVPCDDYRYFKNTDLVIEAVVEDLALKQKILHEVETATGADTIFASNTSALPITKIAEGCSRPENFIGMHYFSPVPFMPLLEIITTDKTAEWVTTAALDMGTRQKKKCIVVKDGPGFYTTRILVAMLNQVGILIEEGVNIYSIDQAMVEFGFPVGPVTLIDEIGIDTAFHVADMMKRIWEPKNIKMTKCFTILNKNGFFGRKTGKGFFDFEASKADGKRQINTEALKALNIAGLSEISAEEIKNRIALTMVNEAVHCLNEGIISSPEDGDTGAVLGLGFPMQKGGPFKFIDTQGAANIVKILEKLSKIYGPAFIPPPVLKDMGGKNTCFYVG